MHSGNFPVGKEECDKTKEKKTKQVKRFTPDQLIRQINDVVLLNAHKDNLLSFRKTKLKKNITLLKKLVHSQNVCARRIFDSSRVFSSHHCSKMINKSWWGDRSKVSTPFLFFFFLSQRTSRNWIPLWCIIYQKTMTCYSTQKQVESCADVAKYECWCSCFIFLFGREQQATCRFLLGCSHNVIGTTLEGRLSLREKMCIHIFYILHVYWWSAT